MPSSHSGTFVHGSGKTDGICCVGRWMKAHASLRYFIFSPLVLKYKKKMDGIILKFLYSPPWGRIWFFPVGCG